MSVIRVRNAADTAWITLGGGIEVIQQDAEPSTTHPGMVWLDTDAGINPLTWTYLAKIPAGTSSSVVLATGLPPGITEIQVLLSGVSGSTDNSMLRIQLGYGATPTWVTAGYDCHAFASYSGVTGDSESNSAGFVIAPEAYCDASIIFFGTCTIDRFHPDDDQWFCHAHSTDDYAYTFHGVGEIDIGNELTAIRAILDGGVFDAGYFAVRYRF